MSTDERPELARRRPDEELPPAAKSPNVHHEWRADERTLRVLLNGLRRWTPADR